ncbi:metallophosphoesterase family protein [Corynebacterium guangdongense]|uniref:DNA repair exonuclease SbcCD nuclease subunit n=1 Tax=Corynebacterium guangdongense TaxID=1783348 RepID=A0ABU1ZZE5_9CORY|nr:metallophosphoesterase [Corynebacterium guangdongense]MDR7330281.1 DNA repair exonuclease SbcCD nuclease subunit [Corynebacterium guangdongense]
MNNSVRLAVIGDTHLGRPRERCHRDEVTAWVGRVVAAAVETGCRALLITGDLFDRRAGQERDQNLRAGIDLLTAAAGRLPVALVWGNHDLAAGMSARVPEIPGLWVAPDTPAVFPLGELDVVGASVAQDRDGREIVDQFPAPVRPTVGLLHTSLDGFADTSVSLPAQPARLTALGYRAWAFGHVHKRVLRNDDPVMFYPGAPWRVDEPGYVELTVPLGEEPATARHRAMSF